jgi:hypothetical protein
MSELSEINPLELLEAAFPKDSQESLFADVAAYQSMLDEAVDDSDFSVRDIEHVITSLDKRLSYMRKSVSISGRVLMFAKDGDGSGDPTQNKTEVMYVEDRVAESLGFTVFQGKSELDPSGSRRLIGLNFNLGHEVIHNKVLCQVYVVKRGFCLPGEVEVEVEDVSRPLHVLAAQASYFYPEIAEDIEAAMLNTDNESDAVMSLAGVSYIMGPNDTLETVASLEHYANALVKFDQKMPYQMEFQGDCFMVLPHEPGKMLPAEAGPGVATAYPVKIQALSRVITDRINPACGRAEITFGLRIVMLDDADKDKDEDTEYVIPITESFSMQSIRTRLNLGVVATGNA